MFSLILKEKSEKNKKTSHTVRCLLLRGDNQIRTGGEGVADLCLTTWLCRPI